KHHKRRVVTIEFANQLAKFLKSGSMLFIQSDVEATVAHMRDTISVNQYFTREGDYSERSSGLALKEEDKPEYESLWTQDGKKIGGGDYGDWLVAEHPIGLQTERE